MPDPRFFSVKPAISVADLLAAIGLDASGRTVVSARGGVGTDQAMVSRVAPSTAPSLDGACIFLDKKTRGESLALGAFAMCVVPRSWVCDDGTHLRPQIAALLGREGSGPVIGVDHERALFSHIATYLYTEERFDVAVSSAPAPQASQSIHPTALIDPRARLGAAVEIGPGVVIGPGVSIGDGCRIDAQSSVFHTVMGPGCVLASGVRLGQAGFGVAPGPEGPVPVPQLGRVIVGARVHLGANTTVDRGSLDDTVIGDDCHIDNLVQIAHNVRMGQRCLIAGQTGIAGSCTIGDDVVMGGQVGFADHVSVGNGAQIAAKAGVMRDIPAGETWCGVPAKPVRQFMREVAALGRLTQKKKK
ncbi:MAG: UDP-3-O-(3-hydroxymyristoyl)glucosamine N-acyltransferase [Pseudomonadota bacterium]